MKALTLIDNSPKNAVPWLSLVEAGVKTMETRTWPVPKNYSMPFDVLLCASKASRTANAGLAVCVVSIVSSHPMRADHEQAAGCKVYPGAWAWGMENLRFLSEKFPVTGKMGFFDIELPAGITLREPTATELADLRKILYAESWIELSQL